MSAVAPAQRPMGYRIVDKVLLERIRHGRLRDVGWPDGLRAIVVAAIISGAIGIALVVFSTPLRRALPLGVADTLAFSAPRALVWVVLGLIVFALVLLQTAALHGVWWLRVLGLATTGAVMVTWGFRGLLDPFSTLSSAVTVAAVVLLAVFTLLRSRRVFAWWEFLIVLTLVSTPVCTGLLAIGRHAVGFGFELGPALLTQSMLILGQLALPAAFAAGTAVAEVTTSATVWAGKFAARYARRGLIMTILAALVLVRGGQLAWEMTRLDPLHQDWNVIIPSAMLALVLGVGIWVMLRHWRTRGVGVEVTELPAQMASYALPIGAALMLSVVPVLVVSVLVSVLIVVAPSMVSIDAGALVNTHVTNVTQIVIGVVLIIVGLVRLRQGRPAAAVLLGTTGVVMIALTSRYLTGGALPEMVDLTTFNAVATVVTIGAAVILLIRRRLTSARAAGLCSLLVLSALFAHRDVLDDPISALLGFSGVAFLLFGLVWTLLTGSAAGNGHSVKFPLPTRVLLLLANTVFTIAVLALAALVRDPEVTVNPKDYSDLGDLMLGTTLLITVFVVVLMTIKDTDSRFGAARPRTAPAPIAPHYWPGSPSPGPRRVAPRPGAQVLAPQPAPANQPPSPWPGPSGPGPARPHHWSTR